jgi:hypothetical protein
VWVCKGNAYLVCTALDQNDAHGPILRWSDDPTLRYSTDLEMKRKRRRSSNLQIGRSSTLSFGLYCYASCVSHCYSLRSFSTFFPEILVFFITNMAIGTSYLGPWLYVSALAVCYYRVFVAVHDLLHADFNRDVLTLLLRLSTDCGFILCLTSLVPSTWR